MSSPTLPPSEHSKIVRRCYQQALTALRQKYDTEFHQILADLYEKHGVAVNKRLSRIQARSRATTTEKETPDV